MQRILCLLWLTLALPGFGRAYADTFHINGALSSGGSLNGTISVDSAGYVTSIDLVVAADGQNFTFDEGPFMQNQLAAPRYAYFIYVTQNTQTGTFLDLFFPGGSPFAGGDLCAISTPCVNTPGSYFYDSFAAVPSNDLFQSLSVTAVPTPEPATLFLVLTGAAGIFAQTGRKRKTVNTFTGSSHQT